MDNDGDTDLVLGEYNPRIRYCENIGSETSPEFGSPVYLLNPLFGGSDDIMTPSVADWDGDGDLDLVVGSDDMGVRAYWNIGSAEAPAFSASSFAQVIPGANNGRFSPTHADWDGDGVLDLLVGYHNGRIHHYRNEGGVLVDQGSLQDALGTELDVGSYARPTVVDWNNDGHLDLLVGNETGEVWLFIEVPDDLPLPPQLAVVAWSVDDSPPLGDGDGVLNPGEEAYVMLSVANTQGWGPVTGVTAVLGMATAGIEVVDSTAAFGDCAPGDTVSNTEDPFRIRTSEQMSPAAYWGWVVAEGTAQGGASVYEDLLPFTFDVNIWQGGWPKATASAVKSSPLLVDLDGDGALEVVVGCDDGTFAVWDAQGASLQGFPLTMSSRIRSSPSAVDLTGDGRPELVFCSYTDTLWVVDGSGQVVLAKHVGESIYGSVALSDIDGDGAEEMVFGTWSGRVWAVEADGAELSGFPVDLGAGARMMEGPAVADLNGDGAQEVVALGADGVVHALQADGAVLPGWPFDTGASAVASAAVATFGGEVWVAAPNTAGEIVVIRGSDGSEFLRFQAGGAIRVSPAWADVDGDGVPEVLFGTQDGRVFAVDLAGGTVDGWPVQLASMIRSSPAVADFDGDGELEVAAACDEGYLYVLRGDGTPLAEWLPLEMPGGVETSPALADMDGDGDIEIALGTLGGVAVVDWKDQGQADGNAWTMHRASVARTAWVSLPTEAEGALRGSHMVSLRVSPNPSSGSFRLCAGNPGTRWRLHLYDVVGRVVMRLEGQGALIWDGDVAPGVYLGCAEVRQSGGAWRHASGVRLIKLQ